MKVIVKILFGSHLYGTDTPDSDRDYKGVFLPSIEDIILNRVPKSINNNTNNTNEKNSSLDVDEEFYSLHYFLKLACDGETVALDMLHAPEQNIIEKSLIWDLIVENREMFYTKNLRSFVGYARKQAAKYGLKGSRLNDAQRVVDYITDVLSYRGFASHDVLADYWAFLPSGDHIHFLPKDEKSKLRTYQVCGKKFQETVRLSYVLPILQNFVNEYGHRARQAANNEGVDWKAVSHAMRAAYQIKSILTENTIVFPLPEANFLLKVKNGELNFSTEVLPVLEGLMNEVEKLSEKSDLPEKVNRKFWDDFLIQVVKREYF